MGGPTPGAPSSLAARIERLFEVNRPSQHPERQWRNSEVVAACRANGRDMSESHLSELRRGIKANPTTKTLDALAWFFGVRTGYLIDDDVAEDEGELDRRAEKLAATLAEQEEIRAQEREAAHELQKALRVSGVTKLAHRGSSGSSRERAAMMRALAKALLDDPDADEEPSR